MFSHDKPKRCDCGGDDCHIIGVASDASSEQDIIRYAELRRGHFAKKAAQRQKAKAYQQARKLTAVAVGA